MVNNKKLHAYSIQYRIIAETVPYDQEWQALIIAVDFDDCLELLTRAVKMRVMAKLGKVVNVDLDISQRTCLGEIAAVTNSAKGLLRGGSEL